MNVCYNISLQTAWANLDSTRQDSRRIPSLVGVFPQLNLWKQIPHSDKYQIDRLIHEDAGCADSSNLYETQARAVRRNYLFFDAWILLLSPVHGKFSWAAGSVVILLNRFTLHYLPGRPRVMDEVQGSNKKGKKRNICIHTIKCFTKERQASLKEDSLFHTWSS